MKTHHVLHELVRLPQGTYLSFLLCIYKDVYILLNVLFSQMTFPLCYDIFINDQ